MDALIGVSCGLPGGGGVGMLAGMLPNCGIFVCGACGGPFPLPLDCGGRLVCAYVFAKEVDSSNATVNAVAANVNK